MVFHKTVLRVANAVFSLVVILLLITAGGYSAFALWDNERVYAEAGDVQADMIRLKPQVEDTQDEGGEPAADFSQLQAVNPDVCAWITMDNTQIDYPVLQGENNMDYLNTDVYGDFSLAGSIFLDSRNARDYSDPFSLLYGHHMADHKMFGDLDLYKDETFFQENTTGLLILPSRTYELEVFACMLVDASDDYIFEPHRWQDSNISNLLDYVEQNSLHVHDSLLTGLRESQEPIQILALSTCSYEFSDARTIVLTAMVPYSSEELGGQ